jgi:hypothetical protein
MAYHTLCKTSSSCASVYGDLAHTFWRRSSHIRCKGKSATRRASRPRLTLRGDDERSRQAWEAIGLATYEPLDLDMYPGSIRTWTGMDSDLLALAPHFPKTRRVRFRFQHHGHSGGMHGPWTGLTSVLAGSEAHAAIDVQFRAVPHWKGVVQMD